MHNNAVFDGGSIGGSIGVVCTRIVRADDPADLHLWPEAA